VKFHIALSSMPPPPTPPPTLTPNPSLTGRGEIFGGGACSSGVCAAHSVRRTHTQESRPPYPGECEACPKGEGGCRGDGAPEYRGLLANSNLSTTFACTLTNLFSGVRKCCRKWAVVWALLPFPPPNPHPDGGRAREGGPLALYNICLHPSIATVFAGASKRCRNRAAACLCPSPGGAGCSVPVLFKK